MIQRENPVDQKRPARFPIRAWSAPVPVRKSAEKITVR